MVDLVGEGFDAAVRLGNLADSSLIARRIAPVHAVMVASPAYLARAGTPRTPAELARHEAVPHGDAVWEFVRDGRRFSYRPRGRFTADSGAAELAGVVAGLGVAAMPAFLAGPAIARGELVVDPRRLRDPAGGDVHRAAAAGRAGADEDQGTDRHHAGEGSARPWDLASAPSVPPAGLTRRPAGARCGAGGGRAEMDRREPSGGTADSDALDWQALALGVAFATIWSSAFTSSRIVVEYWPPFLVLSVRFLLLGAGRARRSASRRGSGYG